MKKTLFQVGNTLIGKAQPADMALTHGNQNLAKGRGKHIPINAKSRTGLRGQQPDWNGDGLFKRQRGLMRGKKGHGKNFLFCYGCGMKPETITELFRRLHAANPQPKSELDYTNPYTLLVAVVLSAQSTDAGVNKATRSLFSRISTPQQMVALGEEALRDEIKTIGLYKNKARNVMALSRMLVEQHHGEVPHDRAALEALPGVGRKTANVVLNIAFGEPTLAVDTHVFRLSNRLGLAQGTTPDEVERQLLEVVPAKYLQHAHHWLILHGRHVCKARSPDCATCPLADLCPRIGV